MFLCSLEDLNQHPAFGVSVNDKQYVIVLNEGDIYAYMNRCPHLAIPLEWQEHEFLEQDSGLIRCATHGALFLPSSGECVSGPCVGDYLTPVAIEIQDGKVFIAGNSLKGQQQE